MATDSGHDAEAATPSVGSARLAPALHRLRSTLARLRGELELAELDQRPPGSATFAALEQALAQLSEVESLALALPARVYVLDDDPRLAELTANRLRRHGFDVLLGSELHTVVSSVGPGDRLVVDYGLLGERHDSAVESILARSRAIVVSGSASHASRERALAMGAVAYLVKPVEFEVLVALLRGEPEAGSS
jgi:CheY-like chemotaxis protein